MSAAITNDGTMTSLRYFEFRAIATNPTTMADALQAASATAAEIARMRR